MDGLFRAFRPLRLIKEQFIANDHWDKNFAGDLLERDLDAAYVWSLNIPFTLLHRFLPWAEKQHLRGVIIVFFMSGGGASKAYVQAWVKRGGYIEHVVHIDYGRLSKYELAPRGKAPFETHIVLMATPELLDWLEYDKKLCMGQDLALVQRRQGE
jgi:hypothetical protein